MTRTAQTAHTAHTARISFRLPKALADSLSKDCERFSVSVSDYIRDALQHKTDRARMGVVR